MVINLVRAVTETVYQYKGCRIAIKQTMKRYKGQRVRTVAYRFHIWTPKEYQYISKKSESLATEEEALNAAQQIVDRILQF